MVLKAVTLIWHIMWVLIWQLLTPNWVTHQQRLARLRLQCAARTQQIDETNQGVGQADFEPVVHVVNSRTPPGMTRCGGSHGGCPRIDKAT